MTNDIKIIQSKGTERDGWEDRFKTDGPDEDLFDADGILAAEVDQRLRAEEEQVGDKTDKKDIKK